MHQRVRILKIIIFKRRGKADLLLLILFSKAERVFWFVFLGAFLFLAGSVFLCCLLCFGQQVAAPCVHISQAGRPLRGQGLPTISEGLRGALEEGVGVSPDSPQPRHTTVAPCCCK